MKMYYLVFIILINCTFKVKCRLYKYDIFKETIPANRLWRPICKGDIGGWMVRIINGNGDFACCGAYIAPRIVVTSGNCIQPYRDNLAGASVEGIIPSEENFSAIETVYTPRDFKEHQNFMDIAAVILRRPIKGKRIEFIKLCDRKITANMEMRSFGWGYSTFAILKPSSSPRNFTVPVLNRDECKEEWSKHKNIEISESVFCVEHPIQDRRKCVYDPGCPLVFNNELCGIASIDSTCIDPKKPGIYTNINKVKEFILKIEDRIKSGLLS